MGTLAEHPTVKRFYEHEAGQFKFDAPTASTPRALDAAWLRGVCLEAGADDAGFVEIGRAELADQRADILAAFPHAKSLISIVCRMNPESLRTPARSVANTEFHQAGHELNDVARRIVVALGERGVRAMNPAYGFPMEMDRFPGKVWVVSHKPVAVAAGLGHMGIHRNVIHPRFGSFIALDSIVLDAEISEYDHPVEYNPCLECKLCVAACPVGAIASDGYFDFSACYTHNYREFMGGFTDWVEQIAESSSALDYRKRVSDPESASMWQSLSFGANYKSAYCLAVCPAGEEVIAPFLTDRKQFLADVVKPLQEKVETLYVTPGSDAEQYAAQRFPHKRIKRVGNGLRPRSVAAFLAGLPNSFQRHRSKGLDATFHFRFTGEESREATVIIRDETLRVVDGLQGKADVRVTADSRAWLRFVARETNLLWALLRGKIRVKGSPRLLLAFGKCFGA